ncbi:MAG: hypothetical protein AAFZ87_04555, partial [Planctomycetota bacterium]
MLEEIENDGQEGAAWGSADERARQRLLAGLLVETGLADKKVAKRWQSAVVGGDFDADACAAEVIASTPREAYESPALLERAARIERDLLMASHMRGVRAAGRRVLAGFDFPFGYPAGVAQAITGSDDPFALWQWLEARIEDQEDGSNNRFEVAEEMNRAFDGPGP